VAAGDGDACPEPAVVPWSGAEELGASVAVTTRHGGVSKGPYDSLNLGLHVGDVAASVVENRRRAVGRFGVPLHTVVFAEQVHGAAVTVVGPGDGGRGAASLDGSVAATDALVTTTPGVTLAILVADCVPIALVDAEARVLGAVHAGWRGTAAGAAEAALGAMCRLGAQPERTVAFLGPAVHPDRYQVGDEVVRALCPEGPDPAVARPDGSDRWLVDLVEANRRRLVAGGVEPGSIVRADTSTADLDYFSDRAARPCGRFALLARLGP
jgi:polyphenol oxidase